MERHSGKHAGHVRKLRPGEEPYTPYCSNWLEVAQSLGAVKPDCLMEGISDSVSAIENCSISCVSQALPTGRSKSQQRDNSDKAEAQDRDDEKLLFGDHHDSVSQQPVQQQLGKRAQRPGLIELPLYKIAKTEAWSRVESSSEEGMSKAADKPEKQESMARQVRRYKAQAQEARSESKDLRGKLQVAEEKLKNKQ